MLNHFVSGLPRSGSTVLSALLRQNPHFFATVTSPVTSLIIPLLNNMSGASEFSVFFNDERRRAIIKGVFDAYYNDVPKNHVVFDTNRIWTGKLALINELYPDSRVICCVRDIGCIIDSIERMLCTNPLQISRIFGFKPGTSIYDRVETLMNSERGLIGLAWSTLREAWFSQHSDKLIIIDYNSLVRAPKVVMQGLYRELGEPWYEHDFNHISHDEPEYDAQLGMPGMHKVRSKVEYLERERCIPPEIFLKYADLNFWLKPEARRKGIVFL